MQKAKKVVCDADFYSVELPPAFKADYVSKAAGVEEVVVTGPTTGSSELFPNAKVTNVDPNML